MPRTYTKPPTFPQPRDTWQSQEEVAALLSQLAGDDEAVYVVLRELDVHRLAEFGQQLHQLQQRIAWTATAKARKMIP